MAVIRDELFFVHLSRSYPMESKIPAVEVKLGFKWQGLLIAVIVGLGIWLMRMNQNQVQLLVVQVHS